MKCLIGVCACLLLGPAVAADKMLAIRVSDSAAVPTHRYLVQQRFVRAVDAVDVPEAAKVNATNAQFGVRWVLSYLNVDRTLTYTLYEAPSRAAVRAAASANGMSIDGITEVPLILPRE
jgi:Protein of unknown function (DUF4242)